MSSPPSSRNGAIPTAPYATRPPSPPSILIPPPVLLNANEPIKLLPSYANIDPTSLSVDDLEIITQNHKEQIAHDSAINWTYESRHVAQPILDFLYLGPSSVARNRQWLRETGITMLLAARDAQMAGIRLMAVDKVAQELGIKAEHVDVSGYHELIRAFPSTVRKINDHMLDVYRGQALDNMNLDVQSGSMAVNPGTFRRGKVLVFCETGNDRSAGVVVAYLMSILGMSMVQACQFVHFKRFCVSLDDHLKQLLKTYEDILIAERTVHRHELTDGSTQVKKTKRGFQDIIDADEEVGGTATDQDRFLGRQAFAPFVDVDDDDDDDVEEGRRG
ncbi:hypothetical protein AAE478_002175 [Parahypoxylon ruwenzoriense]